MPFTHHSHSGQFCGHGENRLEEILLQAIARKMDVFAMTEHMPRREEDLYPEEVASGVSSAKLEVLFGAYYEEAIRLRNTYMNQIHVLIGVEIDWIRPSSRQDIEQILNERPFDIFIGSVHHVRGIPTDYSRALYLKARSESGGTDERLFEDYFDLQLEMLTALKPPVVGHFDVIRLWSDEPNGSFARWSGVWQRIQRNLDYVAQYGGVLELNSAALRKGMTEPYPKAEICQEFMKKNGSFTLSDDSHSIAQVATHYRQQFDFVQQIGLPRVTCFKRADSDASSGLSRRLGSSRTDFTVESLRTHPFFVT